MAKLEAENGFSVLPRPPAPDVDWSQHAVVVVSLGAFTSGPASVEIVNVARAGSRALLDIVVQLPGGFGYQTFVAPYHLIKLERRALKSIEALYTYQTGEAQFKTLPTIAKMADGPGDGDSGRADQPMSWGALKGQF